MESSQNRLRYWLLAPFLLFVIALETPLHAQEGHHDAEPRSVTASRVLEPITLDGVITHAEWGHAQIAGEFVQYEPGEGSAASQSTEVRFLYNEDALFIGARMYDELGRAGVRTRMSRRDEISEGDMFQIVLDTYHDHTGRTAFMVNPSGVREDAGQATAAVDYAWDPVWEAKTSIDELGWSAEIRIPLSQLRYTTDSIQTWGLQLWRYVERLNETSMWSFWGKSQVGGPHRFGHLTNLNLDRRNGGLEVLPYLVAKQQQLPSSQLTTPFHQARESEFRAGVDIKALLSSKLTLDATLNPDFGQIEGDPATVNLTTFEQFFSERRPFFTSGGGLFSFGSFDCWYCSGASALSLFYSRRIGRAPQGRVGGAPIHVRMPDNTTIIGAAKLVGQVGKGVQIGFLDAVTRSEEAQAYLNERTVEIEVEPLTNYFAARVLGNSANGNVSIGALATSVGRKFERSDLRLQLADHATSFGIDWYTSWKNREYTVTGAFALSSVQGTPAAILKLQQSPARYFQRPDRKTGQNGAFTSQLDSSLTALRGFGGYARAAKEGGSFRAEASVNYRSPGFETNDIGFLTQADVLWMHGNLAWVATRPTAYYREIQLGAGAQQQFNFDGDRNDLQVHAFFNTQLRNWWTLAASVQHRPEVLSDRMLRGNVTVRRPATDLAFFGVQSDSRKDWFAAINTGGAQNTEGGRNWFIEGVIEFKPTASIRVSIMPVFEKTRFANQYVTSFADKSAVGFFGQRVVMARLDQSTMKSDLRLSAAFSPGLSLDVVVRPYASRGDYQDYKEFVRPRSVQTRVFSPDELTRETDHDGSTSYHLRAYGSDTTHRWSDTDFSLQSLQFNAVARWEYRPGSTLYLVWQQERRHEGGSADFQLSDALSTVLRNDARNVLMVKVSYWLPY